MGWNSPTTTDLCSTGKKKQKFWLVTVKLYFLWNFNSKFVIFYRKLGTQVLKGLRSVISSQTMKLTQFVIKLKTKNINLVFMNPYQEWTKGGMVAYWYAIYFSIWRSPVQTLIKTRNKLTIKPFKLFITTGWFLKSLWGVQLNTLGIAMIHSLRNHC